MEEEYGYQRSGKKCKEKFENLYKYYKKTKEGKAGRQDGKHYRFFRQLEAICGEASTTSHASTNSETHHHHHHHALLNTTITPTTSSPYDSEILHHHHPNLKCSKSLSLSNNNSSEFETSSSENNNDEDLSAIAYMMKQKGTDQKRESGTGRSRMRRSWRAKVEEIVDSHMRKIIETQDTWMEKMMRVVEQREQEIASKEEERKRNDFMRVAREVHELWAKERAWIEGRDAALMEAVKKHLGKEISISLEAVPSLTTNQVPQNKNNSNNSAWTELEISNLIQLRSGFEVRFQESGSGMNGGYLVEENNGVWDEIAARMGCLGFERSASECKQIWSEISLSLNKTRPFGVGLQLREDDISHSSTNAGTRGNYLTATSEF